MMRQTATAPRRPDVIVEQLHQTPLAGQRVELVERKGLGHPDSICDAIQESISVALCRVYQENFGRILHHNIDKSLLVAGSAEPRLGGGRVVAPMRLVVGDRATTAFEGRTLDIDAVVRATVAEWVGRHLRFVDPRQHIVVQNELKPGSAQLSDIFAREVVGANDTSAAVGYAPLTEMERMVLAAEKHLNSPDFKRRFPEAGEDVKVMGYRRDREAVLTVALAFVDRFIPDGRTYFARKAEIEAALHHYLSAMQGQLDRITIFLNALDDPERGEAGMYLTVLGTSAEGADGGQVGRGNKVNGLIALKRPGGAEAAAGKNPTSHVGKIYSLLSHRLANEIYDRVPGIAEAYVWLCSQIGKPIDQPLVAAVQLVLQKEGVLADVTPAVEAIISENLAAVNDFSLQLARGEMPVC